MILILVNSDIGKKGNIGFRTGHVINILKKKKIDFIAISRGNNLSDNKNIFTLGLIRLLCLFINFLRIYFLPKLDSNSINNCIYEYYVIFLYKFLDTRKIKLVYLWVYSKKLIKFYKEKKIKIITDVSMAPHQVGLKNIGGKIPHYQKQNEIYTILNSNKLISPSKFVKSKILKYYKKKSKVINFASNNFYQKKFTNLKTNKKVKFCFVGLINERKGIKYLIKAWKNNPIFENHILYLCGRVFKKQKKLINDFNFKNVVLTGFVDPQKYLKKSDIFVFPTMMEGSAKAVFEAMAHSMPVITTKEAGSIVENNKNGIIIKSKSTKELNKAMEFFIKNKVYIKSYGKRAYIKSKKYTWKRYSTEVVNFLMNDNI